MAKLLDGRGYAQLLRDLLKKELAATQLHPHLAVVLVGDDKPSHTYVGLKKKASLEVGFTFNDYLLSAAAGAGDITQVIHFLNEEKDDTHGSSMDGIIVQLPLPVAIADQTEAITAAIDPAKDADGFHPDNVRRLLAGDTGVLPPSLSTGILRLIELTGEQLDGKHAVIVAKWPVFAEVLAKLLSDQGVDVEWIRPGALNLMERTKTAHILVTAAGRAGLITGDHIKPGAIVVDVSSNVANGQVVGDVEVETVFPIASWLSPVPGGVGPMTVAMLLWRTYQLACQARQLPIPEIPRISLADLLARQPKAII
jgi:methylenetetrahydrofolate dehydrogenase (NADP+)/methenyltetrahydrofolate cyclohydrolase